MSELAGFDLEQSAAGAWSRFQVRLADRLVEMGEDDAVVIDVEAADELDGASPYVQFVVFGDGTMLRGEVSSDAYLDERYALGEAGSARLRSLGWHEPTVGPGEPEGQGSANFFRDVEVGDGDRLAVMAVKALREVFGVLHPAFLHGEDLGPDETAGWEGSATGMGVAPVAEPEPEERVTMAESSEHLKELVDETLMQMFGEPPSRDDDGDVPVPYGSSVVYVRVNEAAPVVELFSLVVSGVRDRDRAAFEVSVLNRDVRFVKFHLAGDRVVAQLQLPAWPFVPAHLRSLLAGMSSKLDEIGDDLVARVGGRRAIEPEEGPVPGGQPVSEPAEAAGATEPVPIELMTLLQLDAEETGELAPDLVAGVCHGDRGRILELLQQTEREQIAWRRSRDEAAVAGDHEESAACEHEWEAWQRITATLRRALRFVVDSELGRVSSYSPRRARSQRATPRFRESASPQPRRSGRIGNVEDLLRLYGVEDLVLLDERLTESMRAHVEVSDLEASVAVTVEGTEGRLPYPFSSADFQALLEHLRDRARQVTGVSVAGPGAGSCAWCGTSVEPLAQVSSTCHP